MKNKKDIYKTTDKYEKNVGQSEKDTRHKLIEKWNFNDMCRHCLISCYNCMVI